MNLLRFANHFFHFQSAQWNSLWQNEEPSLSGLERLFQEDLFPRRALKVGPAAPSLNEAVREFDQIQEWELKAGVRSITTASPDYPQAIIDHLPPERRPLFLFLRGPNLPTENRSVAIVGTRFPSPCGADSAENFSAYFTTLGIHVVSGLAKGIDTIAHHQNSRLGTIAVLGGGVQDVYPRENETLAEQIVERGGTLISPFPLNQVPLPHNFPIRNELIAALAVGTLVVEGAETSGAAVTAKQALAMGKTVVTLAQDYRSGFGRGAIRLQQAGANLVTSEEEALHALFSRIGGYEGGNLPKLGRSKKREFTFQEFLLSTGRDAGSALVLLEEGISIGKIERIGPDTYRLCKMKNIP